MMNHLQRCDTTGCRLLLLIFLMVLWQPVAQAADSHRVLVGLNLFPNILSVTKGGQLADEGGEGYTLLVVYENEAWQAAQLVKKLENSIRKINQRVVRIQALPVDEVASVDRKVGIFLTEPLSQQQLQHLVDYSIAERVLLFSPFQGDVERGAMVGLDVRSKIRPYLNLKSLERAGLSCNAVLVRMSRTIE